MYDYDIYKNLMYQIQYIGTYGTANPHNNADWVKIIGKERIGSYVANLKEATSTEPYTCDFRIPVLNIFYYPTGNQANPQYKIGYAEIKDEPQSWVYNQLDPHDF